MKTWTKHRGQTSVKLIICATLVIATHCQNSPNHQAQNSQLNQNAPRENSPEQSTEKPEHISADAGQRQSLHSQSHSSVQHGNGDTMEDKLKQEEKITIQGQHVDPPSTQNLGDHAHNQHHFQFDDSYTDNQELEQQGSPEAQVPDRNFQTGQDFGHEDHSHLHHSQQEVQTHSHHQHNHHEEHGDHYHEDEQRHDMPESTFNMYEKDLPTPEDIHKLEQAAQKYAEDQTPHKTEHSSLPNDGPQGSHKTEHSSWPQDEPQGSHKTEHSSWPQDEPQGSHKTEHSSWPQNEPQGSHKTEHSSWPQNEPQGSHKTEHSSWPQNEPVAAQNEMVPEHISATQESPEHRSNAGISGNQPVIPPVLIETEKDGDERKEEVVAQVEKEPEPELTPEERAAEELFIAGEKLINATYYKEYHEAYLNFLEAAKLNHQRAKEYVAFGYLFGDYLPQNVTKSAVLFEELASKGSPRAQMGLAFMYSAGFHYNSSQAKALIYSTFGALGGEPLAQMALGYRYYAGIGVESTCETALTYYRKVATKVADSVTLAGGPVVQRISLQDEAENVGTNNSPMLDDDLLQYYHFLADKGDQQAQVVLGTLYYQGGKGVQINHEQAYHYFSTAAESGNGHALGYLGKMHSEGSPFIRQNNLTAFEFFKKSSEKNNHIGQAGLGMMYLNGLGVDKDVTKAFRYFSLASDQGSVDGQLQLGIMYFSGNGVRTDYKLAVKYFTMASQKGHVLAYYNLAQMHATGTGVLRNCHTAVELFKNVAERGKWSEMLMDAHRMYHEGNVDTALVKYMFLADLGYEVAQSNVAYLLDSGATIKFNMHETHQRALLQYSRAASQGSTLARLKMGDYYYYGLGTDVDYESAASHYRMASEQQNNAQAMFNLGYMHERGLGLKQDVHLAKRFYDMAAETSVDAHVPVTMALLKLALLYGVDVFSKEFEGVSGLLSLLDPMAYFGPQWDLILASALAGFFSIIYIVRRMR